MRHRWSPSLVATVLLSACAGAGHWTAYAAPLGEPEPWPVVVTSLDVVRVGQAQAERFLAALPGEEGAATAAAVQRAVNACVRIEVVEQSSGSAWLMAKGSGALMAWGDGLSCVGTAGHVLGERVGEILIHDTRGERIAVDSARHQYVTFGSADEDWGVVTIAAAPRATPPLPIALPVAGELAFVLTYPDGIGRDADGRMVYGRGDSSKPLQPVMTAAEVVETSPLRLRPLAGAIPLGGASGGAIVDRRGALIGLFNAVVTSFEDDGVSWWLTGVSTAALRER